jgi:POT family proton-dependent oligopeptide transporter
VVLGVGLQANISTMVGLYGQGDIRRDKGFSIFISGINTGSHFWQLWWFGFVVAKWDGTLVLTSRNCYGFRFDCLSMGTQKYLVHVGNFVKQDVNTDKEQSSYGQLFGDLMKSTNQLDDHGIVFFIIIWLV